MPMARIPFGLFLNPRGQEAGAACCAVLKTLPQTLYCREKILDHTIETAILRFKKAAKLTLGENSQGDKAA